MQKCYVHVHGDDSDRYAAGEYWYKDVNCTVLHRVGAPAIVYTGGDEEWYVDGMLHRTDGPAFRILGGKSWYINDKRHRIDGPAVEHASGLKEWWVDGYKHREDGPAVENGKTVKQYWLKGVKVSKAEHARRTNPVQEMTVAEIEAELGHKVKVVK